MIHNASHRTLPRIGITMGDAAGIGSEVVLKAVASSEVKAACIPVVIGDKRNLEQAARTLDLPFDFHVIKPDENLDEKLGDDVSRAEPRLTKPFIYDLANIKSAIPFGIESAEAGLAAGEYIEAGVSLCLTNQLDAIATAPVNKRSLQAGGYNFPGHTEMLAALSNTDEHAMAFFGGRLRIVLLSTHVALAEALKLVTRERLTRTIKLAHRELQKLNITNPSIVVASLNPHGGEGGLFGDEEESEITPAIKTCAREGIRVAGPASADTIFLRASRGEFDCVIALYHDQAMIPIKCLSFGEAVNVTLGLPFVRTSVDHGTAFDIAGHNRAEHSSMIAAITLAAELSQSRK